MTYPLFPQVVTPTISDKVKDALVKEVWANTEGDHNAIIQSALMSPRTGAISELELPITILTLPNTTDKFIVVELGRINPERIALPVPEYHWKPYKEVIEEFNLNLIGFCEGRLISPLNSYITVTHNNNILVAISYNNNLHLQNTDEPILFRFYKNIAYFTDTDPAPGTSLITNSFLVTAKNSSIQTLYNNFINYYNTLYNLYNEPPVVYKNGLYIGVSLPSYSDLQVGDIIDYLYDPYIYNRTENLLIELPIYTSTLDATNKSIFSVDSVRKVGFIENTFFDDLEFYVVGQTTTGASIGAYLPQLQPDYVRMLTYKDWAVKTSVIENLASYLASLNGGELSQLRLVGFRRFNAQGKRTILASNNFHDLMQLPTDIRRQIFSDTNIANPNWKADQLENILFRSWSETILDNIYNTPLTHVFSRSGMINFYESIRESFTDAGRYTVPLICQNTGLVLKYNEDGINPYFEDVISNIPGFEGRGVEWVMPAADVTSPLDIVLEPEDYTPIIVPNGYGIFVYIGDAGTHSQVLANDGFTLDNNGGITTINWLPGGTNTLRRYVRFAQNVVLFDKILTEDNFKNGVFLFGDREYAELLPVVGMRQLMVWYNETVIDTNEWVDYTDINFWSDDLTFNILNTLSGSWNGITYGPLNKEYRLQVINSWWLDFRPFAVKITLSDIVVTYSGVNLVATVRYGAEGEYSLLDNSNAYILPGVTTTEIIVDLSTMNENIFDLTLTFPTGNPTNYAISKIEFQVQKIIPATPVRLLTEGLDYNVHDVVGKLYLCSQITAKPGISQIKVLYAGLPNSGFFYYVKNSKWGVIIDGKVSNDDLYDLFLNRHKLFFINGQAIPVKEIEFGEVYSDNLVSPPRFNFPEGTPYTIITPAVFSREEELIPLTSDEWEMVSSEDSIKSYISTVYPQIPPTMVGIIDKYTLVSPFMNAVIRDILNRELLFSNSSPYSYIEQFASMLGRYDYWSVDPCFLNLNPDYVRIIPMWSDKQVIVDSPTFTFLNDFNETYCQGKIVGINLYVKIGPNATIFNFNLSDSITSAVDSIAGAITVYDTGWVVKNRSLNGFSHIASSADGTKIIASQVTDGIFISTDGGETWTNANAPMPTHGPYWGVVASSSDGTKLIAATSNIVAENEVFISINGGATWEFSTFIAGTITDIACSSNGNYITIVANNDYIHVSTNSGIDWEIKVSDMVRPWNSVTMSEDGSIQLASQSNGYMYISTDNGANFNITTGAGSHHWRSVGSSGDGTILYAVAKDSSTISYVFKSVNSGVSWTELVQPEYTSWDKITVSADGTTIIGTTPSNYYTRISTDSGVTFDIMTVNDDWYAYYNSVQLVQSGSTLVTNEAVLVLL